MKRLFLSLCLLLAVASASAASLQLGGISRHSSPPTTGEWNENNYGIGVKLREHETIRYQLGYYRNSLNKDTFYAIVEWAPIEVRGVKAGLFGGVATGYSVPVIGGAFIDVPITKRVTLTTRIVPSIKKVTPSVVAFEIGVKF